MEIRKAGELSYRADHWPLDPDKPTLIFLHGAGMVSTFWEFQVKALGRDVNTIAIDLPGHGDSKIPGKNNISDYTAAVIDFIDLTGVPGPVPCGMSMGGAIAQDLLIKYPDRFPAGILINTGARLRVMPQIFETIEKNYDDFLEMLVSFAISKKSDVETLRPIIEVTSKCEPDVALGDFAACNGFNVIAKLGAINVPVLIMTAGDDLLTPVKYGAFLKEKIGTAELINIEDAGHLSPIEKPEQVGSAIHDFLQKAF